MINNSREITAVSVDHHGYITHLWNDGASWSPCSTYDAVLDMEMGTHSYFVDIPEHPTQVVEAEDRGGRFLSTAQDADEHNYLLDLPRREFVH